MKLFGTLFFLFALFSSSAFAGTTVYKYGITPFFGMKPTCIDDDKVEVISQVRFYIDDAAPSSAKDFIPAEVRLTVCTISGLILDHYTISVPRFFFASSKSLQGTFPISSSLFSSIVVEDQGSNKWQVRYLDKSGKPWSVIDPIQMTLNSGAQRPQTVRFFVIRKNRWIESEFRLKAEQ